jgi:hypothetical protein
MAVGGTGVEVGGSGVGVGATAGAQAASVRPSKARVLRRIHLFM